MPTSPGHDVETQGTWVAPGYELVAERFAENFNDRGEIGAAFAAHVDGELVVDLWRGWADRCCGRPWQADTLVPIFSGSKGLVATCLLLLLERGHLDLDAPMAHYWPEFARHGKDAVTVREVVSHRAGLPGLTTPVDVHAATDPVRMASLVAEQPAIAPNGDGLIYHALTFGWLCGELVRRIDGRTVGRFLQEELAQPLDLELWIGLPEREESRVAVLERGAGFDSAATTAFDTPDEDPIAWSIWSNPPRFAKGGELAANLPMWHAAEIPATSGIVAARSLARLYGCLSNGGTVDGVRLLDAATITAGTTCLSRGTDPYLNAPMAFATGFQVQSSLLHLGPPVDAFGHTGAGGSVHGAWPTLRTGFSYCPNLLTTFETVDPRANALLRALHVCVARRSRD